MGVLSPEINLFAYLFKFLWIFIFNYFDFLLKNNIVNKKK
jgi:hypothetical protein